MPDHQWNHQSQTLSPRTSPSRSAVRTDWNLCGQILSLDVWEIGVKSCNPALDSSGCRQLPKAAPSDSLTTMAHSKREARCRSAAADSNPQALIYQAVDRTKALALETWAPNPLEYGTERQARLARGRIDPALGLQRVFGAVPERRYLIVGTISVQSDT